MAQRNSSKVCHATVTELVHFRKRIGKEGFETIFQISIALHGRYAREDTINIDTMVQEKQSPAQQLAIKIIKRLNKTAKYHEIRQRCTYFKESTLKLKIWTTKRRVVVTRRKIVSDIVSLPETPPQLQHDQQQLAFIEAAEDFKVFEYDVLVTSLPDGILTITQLYRDRAGGNLTFVSRLVFINAKSSRCTWQRTCRLKYKLSFN